MLKFRKLRADEIDCRVQAVTEKGCSILLYKDARVDQNILDETVGPENWSRSHETIGGNLFCNIGIRIDRGESALCAEWVHKQDVGVESYTEKEKGQASDSFKRACFNWGIGRELYTAPFIWINAGNVKIVEKNGKYTTYDRFTVGKIEYSGEKISYLTILDKNGKVVFTYGNPTANNVQDHEKHEPDGKMMVGPVAAEYIFQHPKEKIGEQALEALIQEAQKNEVEPDEIAAAYKLKTINEITYTQYYTLMSGKYWGSFRK